MEYGALWMFAVLAWLTAANRKCVRENDRTLLMLSNFMVLFAIIERSGLKGPYNFVLMYPLGAVGAAAVKGKLTAQQAMAGESVPTEAVDKRDEESPDASRERLALAPRKKSDR